ILLAVEKRINHESFTTWFKPISFIGIDNKIIRLKIPDRVFEDWILNNYHDVLEEAMDEAEVTGFGFAFEVGQETQKPETRHLSGFTSKPEASPRTETASAAAAQPVQVESVMTTTRSVDTEHTDLPINQKYTFNTFVVGSCNQFAHAAALAV